MTFPEDLLTEKGITGLLLTTINSYESDKPLLSYAITQKENDQLIGATGYTLLSDGEIEVFCALLPLYWGKGFASEVLKKMVDYALSFENCNAVVAPIVRTNIASIRVAEKVGFTNHGLQEHPDYNDLVCMYKKTGGSNA